MVEISETSYINKSIENTNHISSSVEPIETIQKNINTYQSNKNQGNNIIYNEKLRKKYLIKNSNHFDNKKSV